MDGWTLIKKHLKPPNSELFDPLDFIAISYISTSVYGLTVLPALGVGTMVVKMWHLQELWLKFIKVRSKFIFVLGPSSRLSNMLSIISHDLTQEMEMPFRHQTPFHISLSNIWATYPCWMKTFMPQLGKQLLQNQFRHTVHGVVVPEILRASHPRRDQRKCKLNISDLFTTPQLQLLHLHLILIKKFWNSDKGKPPQKPGENNYILLKSLTCWQSVIILPSFHFTALNCIWLK